MASVCTLPDELLLKIFSYLSATDVSLYVTKVCNRWHNLASDSILWNELPFTVHRNMKLSYALKVLPEMKHLKFVRLQWRTDTADVINALCNFCPCLFEIQIICCGYINKNSVKLIQTRCQSLKRLSLGKSWCVPGECLDDLASMTNLVMLNLSHCPVTSKQFKAISTNCVNIVSLNIDYVRGISEELLVGFISSRITQLESISVFGDLLTDNIFKYIEICKNIKLLHISVCKKFTNRCFTSVNKLKYLRSLTLRKAILISPTTLWNFYFNSKVSKNLLFLYISAKRIVTHEDVTTWSTISSNVECKVVGRLCTCMLTKRGFNVQTDEDDTVESH